MKKKIKKDKLEPYKISATIYTNEELEELDHKIENNLEEIVHQVSEVVLTNRENIVLQKVIEKQKAKLEDFEELFSILEEYYSITREDLEEIIRKKEE